MSNPPNPPRNPNPSVGRELLLRLSSSFSGPLPPPSILREYHEIVPGAADRLILMAEDEGRHRRVLEERALDANIEGMRRQFREARLGQLLAFVISALFLSGGVYIALHGHEWSGSIIGGFGLSGIVGSFISGRQKQEPAATTQSGAKGKKKKGR